LSSLEARNTHSGTKLLMDPEAVLTEFRLSNYAKETLIEYVKKIEEEAYQQALDDVKEAVQCLPLECSFNPVHLLGEPIGMFHCPECGQMVLAGMPHPPCESVIAILDLLENDEPF
jgi:hypothetical protein